MPRMLSQVKCGEETYASFREPLATDKQFIPEYLLSLSRLHTERSVSPQLTTVCLVDGQVGGVIISEDLTRPLVPENDPAMKDGTICVEEYMPILSSLEKMQAEYLTKLDKKPLPCEYLHQFLLAVDKRFSRRGIATRLLAKNAELGRQRGFRSVIIETTGRFSQGGCGFVTVGSIYISRTVKLPYRTVISCFPGRWRGGIHTPNCW